jgi:exopolysaccharide biosynthesis polyprenyl glycosylphosphotransferase
MAVSSSKDIRKVTSIRLGTSAMPNWRALLLVMGDVIGLAIAWQIALYLNRSFFDPPIPRLNWGEFWGMPILFWLCAGVIIFAFAQQHFYRHDREHSFVQQAQSISNVYLLSLILGYFYDPTIDAPRSLFLPAWLGSIGAVIFVRLLLSVVLDRLQIKQSAHTVFLIAPDDHHAELKELLQRRKGCHVVGQIDAQSAHDPDTWEMLVRSGVKEVIAEGLPDTQLASQLYWRLRNAGMTLRLMPSSLMMLHRRGTAEIYAGIPTIRIDPQLWAGWEYLCKRAIDRVGALLGLICLAPLMTAIAIAIQLTSAGGAFYSQERVGLNGRIFRMWKFRTMHQDADQALPELEAQIGSTTGSLFKMADDPRVTRLGKFLRRTSLDELPQLFNVLMGQMSLVGPRPFSIPDVNKFADWHHYRHVVIPGITGLWQVSGRSDLSNLEEVAQLDLFYIDYWTLNLDIELLLETVKIVLFGKGAY